MLGGLELAVVSARIFLFIVVGSLLSGCSYGSVFTSEGLMGTSIGMAGGTGAGYLIGEEIGKKTENMALGAGIGSGLGMLAGGMLHEHNVRETQTRQVLIREAKMVGENQAEIDALRERMTESSVWGRSETKSWNDRYWGDNEGVPYEGNFGGR